MDYDFKRGSTKPGIKQTKGTTRTALGDIRNVAKVCYFLKPETSRREYFCCSYWRNKFLEHHLECFLKLQLCSSTKQMVKMGFFNT